MSKDAASSSLPAPLRAIVGVLTLALRAVQLVVRRRRHATQHSPRLAHKSGTPQVATGLIYFIFCQGTMLAKEQKLIKKVPAIVNEVRAGSTTRDGVPQLRSHRSLPCTQGPHCSFVTQQGWHTKYPALGCHKRAFALRDLVSRRALPRRGRDASAALGGSATVVRALRSSWPGQAGAGAQVDADRPGGHGREAIAVWDIGLPVGARAGQKVAPRTASAEPCLHGPTTPSYFYVCPLWTHQIFTSRDSLI